MMKKLQFIAFKAFCICFMFAMMVSMVMSCNRLSLNNSDCYEEKPTEGEMSIRVTLRDTSDIVPVSVYKGKFENNQLMFTDTLRESQKTFVLPVNTYYTGVAEYETGGNVVLAIDGGKISVSKYATEENGYACWRVTNIRLDLRLK